jgi:raffinose/stachyose/melibiose transport system substrate-binding protein
MLLALATSCGSSSSKKGSVYWLNFKPESDEVLQEVAKMYTDETGVEVQVVTAASGTYEQTLASEMDKSNAPTLFVLGNSASVEKWADYAYDLTDTAIAKELNTDAYNLYTSDGKLASIGYCYESYGIIVNTDLLGQAGYTTADITDFASLKAVVEDIHARADELGFDAFTSSGMDSSSSWRFSGHLANMPLYYQSVDAGGWTETPSEITDDYLDNFRQIWDLYINNSTVADPSSLAGGGFDAEGEFVSGKAVFFQNGSWEYSACSVLGDDNIAMIPIYCGVDGEENIGLCSGTENCWAVNAKASEADIEATLDFMYWCVTNEEASAKLVDTFGVMPYTNAADSTNKFLADANELANEGKTTVTWAFNYTPNVDTWRAGVVDAMNAYDADPTDANWDTVVTAFVQGWANQYQAANG